MKLYLDASALVKVFVVEEGREVVVAALAQAGVVATSRLGYVEARAALARGAEDGRLTAADAARAARDLDQRWADLVIVELDAALAREAGELAGVYRLRAADAVHLASALLVAGADPGAMTFACFDRRLRQAARVVGLSVTPAGSP